MLERTDVVLSQWNPVALDRVWLDIFSQRGRVEFAVRLVIEELSVLEAVVLRNSGAMEGGLDWAELVLGGAEVMLLIRAFEVVTSVAVLKTYTVGVDVLLDVPFRNGQEAVLVHGLVPLREDDRNVDFVAVFVRVLVITIGGARVVTPLIPRQEQAEAYAPRVEHDDA